MEFSKRNAEILDFLQEDLAIPASSIATALCRQERGGNLEPLSMILWQYGLVSLEQLEQIFDWLER